jgi:fucose permease
MCQTRADRAFLDDSSAGAGDAVTHIGAGLVAILVGWIIDTLFQPYLGTGATLMLSFVVSSVAFFMARKWLNELRDG